MKNKFQNSGQMQSNPKALAVTMDILHRQETILNKLVFVDMIKKCNPYEKKCYQLLKN